MRVRAHTHGRSLPATEGCYKKRGANSGVKTSRRREREKKGRNITLSSSSINSNLSLSRSSWTRYAFKARQRVRKEKIKKGGEKEEHKETNIWKYIS